MKRWAPIWLSVSGLCLGASPGSAQERVDRAASVERSATGLTTAELSFARRFTDTLLILNVGYGQSLATGDSYGRMRAASLTRLVDALSIGLEGRARFDLGFDDDTPGEAAYDLIAGPLTSYALSRLVLSLGGGPSLVRFTDRPSNTTQRGALLLGFALHAGVGLAL